MTKIHHSFIEADKLRPWKEYTCGVCSIPADLISRDGAALNIFRTYEDEYSESYTPPYQNPQLAVYLTAPEDQSITGNLKIELLNPAYTVAGETIEFSNFTGWYIEGSGVLGDGSVSSSYYSANSGIDDSDVLNFLQQIFSTGGSVSLDAGSKLSLWVSIGNMLLPDTEARAVYGSVSSVTHLSQALCTVDAGFRLSYNELPQV